MTPRLAILHWVRRLVRREWRQHALVVAMVAFGIAASVVAVTTVVRLEATPDESSVADAAMVAYAYPGQGSAPPEDVRAAVEDILAAYPDVELIASAAPGPEGIALVAQEPAAALGRPWVDLLDGRWPGPGEITLSARALAKLDAIGAEPVRLGDRVTLGGEARTVVGRYENPLGLDALTGIVPRDEIGPWEEFRILLPDANHPAKDALLEALRTVAPGGVEAALVTPSATKAGSVAMLGYLLGAVLLLQIAVLASAGFTVLANRRARHLGMLSALGATPGQLGSVLLLTGLVLGVVGGVLGLGIGVGASMLLTGSLQRLVDFRLSATGLPWRYLLPMAPLAVATAMAGAWWPARRVRRISAIDAIADRAGRKAGFARSLASGVGLLAAGGYGMTVGAPKNDPLIVVASTLAVLVGGLLLAPAVTGLLGAVAGRTSVPLRLAWRDIARNRSRSSSAVAAAAIALALPFGLATFAGSLATTWQPSVPDDVVEVSRPYDNGAAIAVDAELTELAASVPGTRIVPVVMAVDRELSDQVGETIAFGVNELRRNGGTQGLRTAVATPELLALMGIEPEPGADLIVTSDARLDLDPSVVVQRELERQPTSYPEALLLRPVGAASLDDTMTDFWFLVGDSPFTSADRDRLEFSGDQAGFASMTLPGDPPPFVAIRSIALAAGALFALAAVAVAVALIRTEARNESEVLRAVGAGPLMSRTIGAATAAGLSLAAGLIAVPSTFILLAGVFGNPDEDFDFAMPWPEVAIVLIGLPLVAATAGGLLTPGGRRRIRVAT